MGKNCYTKLQQDIIDGKIDIKTVHGTAIAKLRSKALALGDADVVRMAEEQLTVKKENARLRNIERVKKSYWERKEKGFEWKPPRSEEYTERQMKIICGEIQYDDVATKELVWICVKAQHQGDRLLAELMESLISDRKAESHERSLERKRLARQRDSEFFSSSGKLTKLEKAVLEGTEMPSKVSLNCLYHIRDICLSQNDTKSLKIAEQLISYRLNPTLLYPAKTHDEAVALFESLLWFPLIRAKAWKMK